MRRIEIPFSWTCPKCRHAQTDTVNPAFGPFLNIVCENCGPRVGTFELEQLSEGDAFKWSNAMDAASAELKQHFKEHFAAHGFDAPLSADLLPYKQHCDAEWGEASEEFKRETVCAS